MICIGTMCFVFQYVGQFACSIFVLSPLGSILNAILKDHVLGKNKKKPDVSYVMSRGHATRDWGSMLLDCHGAAKRRQACV